MAGSGSVAAYRRFCPCCFPFTSIRRSPLLRVAETGYKAVVLRCVALHCVGVAFHWDLAADRW